jgi:hypothetical protein
VDAAGYFFTEGTAVVRLALREAGEVLTEPGFGCGPGLKAGEQLNIEEDDENQNR